MPSGRAARGRHDLAGIFLGMFCTPEPHDVCGDLGDKVIHGISWAVRQARYELEEYRRLHPGWVAQSTERGLANWIHDRLWAWIVVALDGLDGVTVIDHEPIRELYVGTRYRLRVKRHHLDGRVASYPTQE